MIKSIIPSAQMLIKPAFHIVVSVVSVVYVLRKTTDTAIWKPSLQRSIRQIQHAVGVIRHHFVNGKHCMQLIRQMQQKCVPEYTSFVFKVAADVEGNVFVFQLLH